MKQKTYNISVIGGGTGTFTVLSGLKQHKDVHLSAIINITDSGGSTGILRNEFQTLPVGDFRQALVALASEENGNQILRELFLYRFEKGTGLKGHNFGNLLLTALTDILGDEHKAIQASGKILRIYGEVIPIARDDVDLVAEYSDGSTLVGEAYIDEPNTKHDCSSKIVNLKTQPQTEISREAEFAIKKSDAIIVGPGDLFSSILSNIVVKNVPEVMQNTKAKLIYISNLMTKHGQTNNMSVNDCVEEIKKYSGRYPDYVLVNDKPIPEVALKKYAEEKELPVKQDLEKIKHSKVITADLLQTKIFKQKKNDSVKRSLIRHDSDKLAKALYNIIKEK